MDYNNRRNCINFHNDKGNNLCDIINKFLIQKNYFLSPNKSKINILSIKNIPN